MRLRYYRSSCSEATKRKAAARSPARSNGERMNKPLSPEFGSIGKADAPQGRPAAADRQGRFTDDFRCRASLRGDGALALSACTHRLASTRRAAPRCRACWRAHRRDCVADELKPIPHDPLPKTKYDMKLTGPGGEPIFIGPHLLLPADKARHVGEAVAMVVAETRGAGAGRCRGGRGRLRRTALRDRQREGAEPGAPRRLGRVPDNVFIDTWFGDRGGDRRAPSRRPRTSSARISTSAASPRVTMEPRAALGDYDAATGRYTLYAGSGGAVRQKARDRRGARHRAEDVRVLSYDVGGNFGATQPRLRRVRPGRSGPRARSAARSNTPRRARNPSSPTTRAAISRDASNSRSTQGRPLPRDARRQPQQRRRALRVAVAARQGLGPDHRLLRHSGRDFARARRVHQHHADPRLSLAPAGRRSSSRSSG